MNDKRPSWDEMYMSMAYLVASRSPDESTHSGCVIVAHDNTITSIGYNGLPRNVANTPERQERPLKYQMMEHAERNAIYNAGRNGVPLQGCKLYINWLPCSDCARAIIQAGISHVVIHHQGQLAFNLSRNDTVWAKDHDMVVDMLNEGGVTVQWYDGPVLMGTTGFWSGKRYAFLGNPQKPTEIASDAELVWMVKDLD